MTATEMHDGMRVRVLIAGDPDRRIGTVTKARKMWVELDDKMPPYIADENNITEWTSADDGPEGDQP